jgi:hypothetical protein
MTKGGLSSNDTMGVLLSCTHDRSRLVDVIVLSSGLGGNGWKKCEAERRIGPICVPEVARLGLVGDGGTTLLSL